MNFKNFRFPKRPLELLSVQEMDELSEVGNTDERKEVADDDILPILDVSSSLPNRAKKITAKQLVESFTGAATPSADLTLSNLSDYDEARDNLGLGYLATKDQAVFETVSDVENTILPETVTVIRTAGEDDINDGKGKQYEKGESSDAGAIQSGDGQWWKPGLLTGSDSILNDSDVDGTTVSSALETLRSSNNIWNDSDLAGYSVSDALNNTPGFTLLGDIILEEDYQGLINFSDIPPDFVNLVLTFSARIVSSSPGDDLLRARINSTSTAPNSYGGNAFLFSNTSTVGTGQGTSTSSINITRLPDGSNTAGIFGVGSLTFFDYANNINSPHLSVCGGHEKEIRIRAGINTNPGIILKRLILWCGGTSTVNDKETFSAGSRFSLWGVRGNPPVAALWGGL